MADYVHYQRPKGPKLHRIGKYSFSNIEIKHLSISLIMITLTLMALQKSMLYQIGIINFIIVYFLSVGLGFLLHELGHKFVAQYYGYISEFRADFTMLFASFFIALVFNFTFLAPGAVMILGRLTRKQNGIISVAGPLVNLTLAIIYILLAILISPTAGSLLWFIFFVGISINAFLGIFNMLPFWVLDGKKVLAWNKPVYFTVMLTLIIIFIFNNANVFL